MENAQKRVLAAASGGGHWQQLMQLRCALDTHDVRYATTHKAMAQKHGIKRAAILPDCNINTPISAARCALAAGWLIARTRPDVVISTGAAPGFFCLVWGRIFGAQTLWIDSIANGERLSKCGAWSKRVAHECLTQWPQLAAEPAVKYRGAVL